MATKKTKTAKTVKAPKAAPKAVASKPKAASGAKPKVSAATLERLPTRAVAFLIGIGTILEVRTALATRGYNDVVHQKGWGLIEAVGGRSSLAPPPVSGGDDAPEPVMTTAEAVQQLEVWAPPNFTVADAALQDNHPDQHAFVFAKNLKARRGSAGVLAVQTFLSRLDGLGAKGREALHADDHAALALLGERGITVAERTRVRGIVDVAQKGIARPATSSADSPSIVAAKLALYVWHKEWAAIARTVVTRRDHLIRMDLATRQKKKPDPKTIT